MGTTGALCKSNPGKAKRDETLVAMRMDGASLSQIEEKLGYSKGHLSRLLNHDKDIKALIEEASKLQAAMLPLAAKRHTEVLASPETSDKDLLQAIKLTYTNTGVSPSHTTPTVINNVLVQQQTILDPKLMAGFGDWFFNNQDVIEAETTGE